MADLAALYLTHLRARGLSGKTLKRRRLLLRRLAAHLAPLDLADASPDLLDGFLGQWSAPATLHAYRSDVRSFYAWAVARRAIPVDPACGLGAVRVPPPLPRPVTDDELHRILAFATGPNERTAVLLGALAGLRCAEMAGLDHRDVDPGAGLVRIDGKGGRVRVVPLHPVLAAHLADGHGPVLRRRDGRPLSPDAVSVMGCALFARAGVPGGFHRLRHWFGTAVQHEGHDVLATARLLGHVSVATTQGYAAADVAHGEQLVRRLRVA